MGLGFRVLVWGVGLKKGLGPKLLELSDDHTTNNKVNVPVTLLLSDGYNSKDNSRMIITIIAAVIIRITIG